MGQASVALRRKTLRFQTVFQNVQGHVCPTRYNQKSAKNDLIFRHPFQSVFPTRIRIFKCPLKWGDFLWPLKWPQKLAVNVVPENVN